MPPHPPVDNAASRGVVEKDITVLVTGFGPFQQKYPVNPSIEIARSLPDFLPQTSSDSKAVRVISYGSPIRVCYAEARKLIAPLLESYHGTIDLVLHIGMASGRPYYSAEQFAHRDNYAGHKDLDGEVPSPEEAEELFGDCPVMMTTSLKFDDLMNRWQALIADKPAESPAHGADCRPSHDAGHFLCDYVYFNSLAWYGRRNTRYEGSKNSDRPVMFLHVPGESDEATLEKGREVALALIRSMADTYTAAG